MFCDDNVWLRSKKTIARWVLFHNLNSIYSRIKVQQQQIGENEL